MVHILYEKGYDRIWYMASMVLKALVLQVFGTLTEGRSRRSRIASGDGKAAIPSHQNLSQDQNSLQSAYIGILQGPCSGLLGCV